MADLQLPTISRGAAGIDQAIDLLRTVTLSLVSATEEVERGYEDEGEDDVGTGAHRERRTG